MDTVYHRRSRILTQSHMWVAHKVDLWYGFLIQFIHTTTIYVCRKDIGLLTSSLPSSNSSIKSSKGPKEEVFASQVANLKTCRWLRKTSAIMEGAWLLPTTALIFRSFTFPNAIQTFGQEAFFQEFTWRSNNVVVRGSHCMYEENQPSGYIFLWVGTRVDRFQTKYYMYEENQPSGSFMVRYYISW